MLDRNSPEIAEFIETFLRTSDFKELALRASEVVGNPVALIDSGYNFLGWSHLESVPDQTWFERIKEGCWDYDFVTAVKRHTPATRQPVAQSAIVTDISPLRRRIDTLVLRGRLLGYSVVLELNGTLEETDEDVYAFVRDILTKAVAAERAYYMHSGAGPGTDITLADLLGMHFPNRILFHERIKRSEFNRKTEFQVYSLSLEQYTPRSGQGGRLKTSLAKLLPESWSAYDEDSIVVLIDRAATLHSDPDALEAFATFLEEHALTAGQSTVFGDLYELPAQRQQAERALEIVREVQPGFLVPEGTVIVPYERVKMLDLLRRVPADDLAGYCHSAIVAAAQYDAKHNSDYLKTIFQYLGCARSIHEAAKALFVHHNTVYYRMTRARELFNLDFSSEHRNVHYYLSCLILLYMR